MSPSPTPSQGVTAPKDSLKGTHDLRSSSVGGGEGERRGYLAIVTDDAGA